MNEAFGIFTSEARQRTLDLFRKRDREFSGNGYARVRAIVVDDGIDSPAGYVAFACCPFGASLYFDERFVDRVAREPSLFVPQPDRLASVVVADAANRQPFEDAARSFIKAWDDGKLSIDDLAVALGVSPTDATA